MLEYLNLENFAIIEKLDLDFHKGLNCVTGETGAGKSIIIDAISIACGERCGTNVIGRFEDSTKIRICFNIENYPYIIQNLGEYVRDNRIIISREIFRNGRNVFKVNDSSCNGQTVKNIASYLLDVNGQHEHQKLFSSAYHLELIDSLTPEIGNLKKEYSRIFREYKELRKKLEYLKNNQYEIKRNIDLYTYEINEIDKAELKPGEEEVLEQQNEKLQNIEKLTELIGNVYNLVSGDYGAESIISDICGNMNKAKDFDSKLSEKSELIENISAEFDDFSSFISDYLEELREGDFDFQSVYDRLNVINSMKNKYSMSVEEILAYRDKIDKQLSLFTSEDFNAESMEEELKEKYEKLKSKAYELSDKRKTAAKVFEKNIENNLNELAMPDCKFEVDFAESDFGEKGCDDVEFLISPNQGMPLMSMRKIASGGELSRVSLAVILNRLKEPVPLVIFDEIDSGIGGVTGEKIGNKLREMSQISQVICITHLPQIAAKGDRHFNVSKCGKDAGTNVEVVCLEREDRIRVIANMFGGSDIANSLEHADELLRINGN